MESVRQIQESAFWSGLTEAVNTLHNTLQRKPKRLRIVFTDNPGSILNAYREGDLTFKQAVKQLEKWKRSTR
ncbi:MAG TPA: hypothetical protein PLD99_01620 [Parcubacteria group bacterium]|nr:hypothetical protein [Parcubacteria group bacterium]